MCNEFLESINSLVENGVAYGTVGALIKRPLRQNATFPPNDASLSGNSFLLLRHTD